MSEFAAALVWCPFPNCETARSVGTHLLEEKLIACANILPKVESLFVLQGEMANETETAVLFKTREDRLEQLVERLGEIHPYDTPAIVGWVCNATHPATWEWLSQALGDRS